MCLTLFTTVSLHHTGVEEAVSHWPDKSFYVAWTTLNVWIATARGLATSRELKAHRPYCAKHNQHEHANTKGSAYRKTFKK